MSRRTNSVGAFKWGLFSQIGRNLGNSVYKAALNGIHNADTSGVDQSTIGVLDEKGHFYYHTFKKTSFGEYFFWLVFIAALPYLSTPILFFKTIIRVSRRKVRFVVYHDCPSYDNNHRYVGKEPVAFEFKKSYEEAEQGVPVVKQNNDSVNKTKLNTLLYAILTGVSAYWCYYMVDFFYGRYDVHEEGKMMEMRSLTNWTDSVFTDDFSGSQENIRYAFPKSNTDELLYNVILVQNNGQVYLYIDGLSVFSHSSIEYVFYHQGDTIYKEEQECEIEYLSTNEEFVVKPKFFPDCEFDYRHTIPKEMVEEICRSDSFAIRLGGESIYRFCCGQ